MSWFLSVVKIKLLMLYYCSVLPTGVCYDSTVWNFHYYRQFILILILKYFAEKLLTSFHLSISDYNIAVILLLRNSGHLLHTRLLTDSVNKIILFFTKSLCYILLFIMSFTMYIRSTNIKHTCIREESDGLKSMTKTRRYWWAINVTSVSGARKNDGGLANCSRSESTSSDGTQDNTSNSSSLLFQNKQIGILTMAMSNNTKHCQ